MISKSNEMHCGIQIEILRDIHPVVIGKYYILLIQQYHNAVDIYINRDN